MKTSSCLATASLALLLAAGSARADIQIHGSTTAYTTTDKDWLSHTTEDIDANGLGTAGWLFFGDFDGIAEADRPLTHRIESLPTYITGIVAGANFLSVADEYDTESPGFGIIDDPTTLDGSDARSGALVADGGVAGDSLEILSFTVSGLTTPVRVGILSGTEQRADGRWDPTSITLSDGIHSATVGDHATSPLPFVPDSVTPNNVGWVFFDIDADGTYTISATKRLATQGVSIGGLTFDTALPAPVLHWAFEEAAGTTTTESISGASDIATLIEGPARVAGLAPSSTGALDFQITTPGSYVDAGTLQSDGQYAAKDSATDSKVLNGQWTMAAWVEIPVGTSGGDRCILTSDNDLSDPWLFFVTSVNGRSNNLGFDFGAVRIRSNLNVPTGRPVFVAVSADPAASAFGSGNKHRFAIWDGVTWSYVEGSTYAAARLKGLEIGSWNSGQRQFNGAIDEVRIYDTALSKEELTALALQNTIGAGLGGMVSSPALPTNSSSVDFTVQFTEPVTGFDASDLIVACDPPGSLVCGTPVITGAGSLYQVSVPVQGEGTLLLDLQTGSGIQNLAGDPLAIQSGGSAIIDLTPPQLLSITPSTTGTVTSADFLIFTAVFSEPVLGLNATTLDTSGSGPGTIVTIDFSTIDGINHSFKAVLTVNDGDTGSSLRVSVLLDAGVTDLAGNALIGPVPTSADVIFSASPYQLWAINKGLTAGLNFASNLDPDGDGRINGEECLHDGNPLVAGDPVKQRFHLVEQPGGKYGVLTLATPDSDPYDPIQTGRLVGAFGAPSVRVSDYIEASSNLADWGTGPGIVEDPSVLAPAGMPALSPGWTYRHFRFTDPVSVLPKAFIRSRVVVAP